MYRGISIENNTDDGSRAFLMEIIRYLQLQNHVESWIIGNFSCNNDSIIFDNGIYTNKQIYALISGEFQLLEIDMLAYETEQTCFKADAIRSYKQFKESDCQAMIFCADSGYYDVYLKSYKDIIKLHQKLRCYKDIETQLITDENDGRCSFF